MSLWEDERRFQEDKMENELMEYMLRDGEWFRTPKILSRAFGLAMAGLIAFLVNHRNLCVHQEKNKKYKNWFFCSRSKLCKELGLTKSAQHRQLAKLIEIKLIEVKMKGIPPRRWMKIDFGVLERILRNRLKIEKNSKKEEKD